MDFNTASLSYPEELIVDIIQNFAIGFQGLNDPLVRVLKGQFGEVGCYNTPSSSRATSMGCAEEDD